MALSAPMIPRVPRRARGGSRSTPANGVGSSFSYAVLLVPALILILVFLAYPLVSAFLLSFQRASTFTGGGDFVGLDNYARFFVNPDAGELVWHTYLRAVAGAIPSYIVGLLAALVLNRGLRRLNGLAKILVLLPFAISAPIGIQMWQNMLNPQFGLPNALGIEMNDLFSNPTLVWPTLLLINMWSSFQFYTILLLAGLQRIPKDLHEAAQLDGAGTFARFRHVTLPGIGVLSVGVLAIHFMSSFQDFQLVYIATGGGPLGVTQTVPVYSYLTAFSGGFDIGYGAALSVINLILMLLTLALLAVVFLVIRRLHVRASERRLERQLAASRSASHPVVDVRIQPRRSQVAPLRVPPPVSAITRFVRRHVMAVWTLVFILFSLFPVLFLLSQSLSADTSGRTQLIPTQFTLDNFISVLTGESLWAGYGGIPPVALSFVNSAIVTTGITVLTVVVASLAGFALARWASPFANGFTALLLVIQFIPGIMLLFPLYLLLATLGLLDTLPGLILATSSVGICGAILFFRLFFHGMPREMEEAAAIDGAGTLRTFFRVVLPNSWPGIAAIAGFTIVGSWNEYIFALTFVSSPDRRTFPPALDYLTSSWVFMSEHSPGQQAVFLLIPIITSAIVLSFTVRQLTLAVSGGGTKG